jgi:PAS domain S-box-containing protein
MGSMVCFIGIVVLLSYQVAPVKAAAAAKRVLVLYWYNKDFSSNVIFDRSFQTVLKSAPAGSIEYYTEYVESNRFPGENQSEALRDYLRQKYASRTIDVVVAVSDVPLEFLLKYRDNLFTQTPIVFVAIERPATNEPFGPGLTGIVLGSGYKKTLDLALRLHPRTKQVFIISGTLNHDKKYETLCREEFQGLDSGISINYFTDLSVDELIFKTKRLPERSVVLYIWQQSQNEQGQLLESADVLTAIAPSTTAPIYGVANWQVGQGIVGGYLRTFEADGTRAAEIALQIANGARAQDIPIESVTRVPIFDWGELHRWGINENLLPSDSVIQFRKKSFWDLYKWQITAVCLLVVAETLLIFTLLWQKKRRRAAETVLLESEERFRRVANSAPVLIWMSGPDKLCTYFNQSWLEFTGRAIQSELGNGWAEGIHQEDLLRCLDTSTKAFDRREPFEMEYRLRRHDGEYRWLFAQGVPRFNADDSFSGYIGSCIDVTERKLAEEALSAVSRRLIEAQEQERTYIARELHDDVNQRIALLAVNLERLKQDLPASAVKLNRRIEEAHELVLGLGNDIQALSHRLHSSKLEYLGLEAAAASFCRELSDRQNVQVDFRASGIAKELPQEISLCLFRVLQQALQNAAKHSGMQQFEVGLRGESNEIHLTVRDQGIGFDTEDKIQGFGIGLTSMRERMKLVDGELTIESQIQRGTTIRARVPLKPRMKSADA